MRFAIVLICLCALAGSAAAAQRTGSTGSHAQRPVATQPSNNPFANPIGQGVPRAASRRTPSGFTSVPLNSH